MTDQSSFHETADNYLREIVRCDDYRIILCKDSIQWIIQRARPAPEKAAPRRRRTVSYCASRDDLKRHWCALKTGPTPKEFTSLPRFAHHGQQNTQFEARNQNGH